MTGFSDGCWCESQSFCWTGFSGRERDDDDVDDDEALVKPYKMSIVIKRGNKYTLATSIFIFTEYQSILECNVIPVTRERFHTNCRAAALF